MSETSSGLRLDAVEEFRAAMRAEGIAPADDEVIIPDDRRHRFRVEGDKSGSRNGAYRLCVNADGLAFGWFGTHKGGWETRAWCGKSTDKLTAQERSMLKQRRDEERRRFEQHELRKHQRAAKRAQAIVEGCERALSHQYLTAKGFPDTGARIYRGPLVIGNMTCDGAMVASLRDCDDVIHGLQFIAPDGRKRFLPGARKKECFTRVCKFEDAKTIVVAEGIATALSIHYATELPAVAAMDCGNLEPVARALRAKYPNASLIIAADFDSATPGNPGVTHAAAAARAVGALLAVPQFPNGSTIDGKTPTDFNDLMQIAGLEEVKRQMEAAQPVGVSQGEEMSQRGPNPSPATVNKPESETSESARSESVDHRAVIADLARLDPIEYERRREAEAEKLGVRVGVLDAEVSKVRPAGKDESAGKDVIFPKVEPWPESVNLAELLDECAATVRRFVILSDHAGSACALWIAFTHAIASVGVAPILAITSPERRCGKTNLLGVLARLVARPLPASNITAAAFFRAIEKWKPTLMIDEGETFIRENEELRGVINSGHTRESAFVVRTTGDDHEPRHFSTWGAKTIAMIGKLPDTLADRSIGIELRRKLGTERAEKLRHTDRSAFVALSRKLVRWAADTGELIRSARPAVPPELNDRAADNWEPLLAIADLAGGDWAQEGAYGCAGVVRQCARRGFSKGRVAARCAPDIRTEGRRPSGQRGTVRGACRRQGKTVVRA